MTTPTSSPAACTSAEDPQSLQDPVLGGVLETSATDSAVRPQDDLFRYVNGTWLTTVEIPADRSSTGTFLILRDAAEEACGDILAELAADVDPTAVPTTSEAKIAHLYSSFLDD